MLQQVLYVATNAVASGFVYKSVELHGWHTALSILHNFGKRIHAVSLVVVTIITFTVIFGRVMNTCLSGHAQAQMASLFQPF